MGLGYRGDRVAAPDDWNARAFFTSLHAGGDKYCDRPAQVGNIAVWLIWTGQCLAAAVLVREQDLLEFGVTGTNLGYRCAARTP